MAIFIETSCFPQNKYWVAKNIAFILTHGVSRRIFGGCLRSRMSFDTHWFVCKSKNKTVQPLPNRSLKDFWPTPITTANCLIRTRFPSYIYLIFIIFFLFFWYFPHVCSSNLFSRSGEFHSNWPEFKACRSSEWLSENANHRRHVSYANQWYL